MTLAVFLPPGSAKYVASLESPDQLTMARSWDGLNEAIIADSIEMAIVDPSADGLMNIDAVAALLRNHPSVAVLAYVPIGPANLKAVLRLSRLGLTCALIHPADGVQLWEEIERASSGRLSREFLAFMGVSRLKLPATVFRAVQDLFERPQRYSTAYDIALQAESSIKRVYRHFEIAHLGSPKKIVTAAKMLRGYAYLRVRSYTIREVCDKLGYADTRIFAAHIRTVFGCCPSSLRCEYRGDEVVRQVLEWYCKR